MIYIPISFIFYKMMPISYFFNGTPTRTVESSIKNKEMMINSDMTLIKNTKHDNLSKKLVVILAWTLAQEKHINKHRQLYSKYDFDVLTIKCNPINFMCSGNGSQELAKSLLNLLKFSVPFKYNKILFVSYSAGAYQFIEFLHLLNQGLIKNDKQMIRIRDSIKGVVCDSISCGHGNADFLVKEYFGTSWASKFVGQIFQSCSNYFRPFLLKRILEMRDQFNETPLRCPALFFISENDNLIDLDYNNNLIKRWTELGIKVTVKCWKESIHVSHYYKHPQEYEDILKTFLESIGMGKQPPMPSKI